MNRIRLAIVVLCVSAGRQAQAEPPEKYQLQAQQARELLRRTESLVPWRRASTPPQGIAPLGAPAPVVATVAPPVSNPTTPAATSVAPLAAEPPRPFYPAPPRAITVGTAKSKRLALLVGVDRYQAVRGLQGAVNDVKNMASLLTDQYGFAPDDIVVLSDELATRETILDVFRRHLIGRAEASSVVVFHYSGHGSQMKDDDGDEPDDHLDETIVPVDARTPGVYDITDDELNRLFRELTVITPRVTFLLDCCHSGTQIKGLPDEARNLARQIDPDERPVAPRAPLSSKSATGPRDSAFDVDRYTLLAGCQDKELSYEYYDPQTGAHCGILTNFLVSELQRTSDVPPTYRRLFERVAGRVTAIYPTQHPSLQGQAVDDFVFSDGSPRQRSVVVQPSGAGGTLIAGAAQGIVAGSTWEVYPSGERRFAVGSGVGTVEVVDVGMFDSTFKRLQGGDIPADGRAVLRGRSYGRPPIKVYFVGLEADAERRLKEGLRAAADASKPSDGPVPLTFTASVAEAQFIVQGMTVAEFNELPIERNPFVKLPGDKSRLVVLTAVDGTVLSKPTEVVAPDLVPLTIERLSEWTKRIHTQRIVNQQPSKLDVEFVLSGPSGRADIDGSIIRAKSGDQLTAFFKNRGTTPVYLALVRIAASGKVRVDPVGESLETPLQAGKDLEGTLDQSLDSAYRRETNYLRLFITSEFTDFSVLEAEAIKGGLDETPSNAKAKSSVLAPKGDWKTETRVVEIVGE